MGTVWRVLTRKKILDPVSAERSELARVLNTWDLTALGVGSTLGVGVYVLAGQVAKQTAGPAVVLSFVIATIASVFAGLCYAEFGARTPRAGSAYIYSYVSVGEFVAFVIGWNLILEYVIGSASVARSLSLYLDSLLNDTLKDTFREIAPINGVTFMASYFDFFAFGISVLLAVALAFGLKESSVVNNIFTLINLFVVLFVIIAGATKADTANWDLPASNTTGNSHGGGFFPFGVEGMIKGAATCFYGFVGFDCIATTGEEVKNPKRAIPIAIIFSLFIIFLAYFGTSTIITLMVPFYNEDIHAPLPSAFETVGMSWAKWVVTIGGIFGLCASLFGAMFPLPRIIYAMASDTLVFRFLGRVSSRFKTPVVGTILAGLLTGLMAALFDLNQLINMMSIGTLLAYTIVAASVLLLRYTDSRNLDEVETSEEVELMSGEVTSSFFKQIFNCGRQGTPSEVSEKVVKVQVCLYCLLCVLIGVCALHMKYWINDNAMWGIILTAVVVSLAVLVLMSITTQPQSRKELSFKVPLVPLIPALSILINIYLMLMLDTNTWIRFGVWMIIGLPTYYFSVKTHSDARNESICSRDSTSKVSVRLNGFTNHSYVDDETKTKEQTSPPISSNIEATIAVLDLVLEREEANIIKEEELINDRKLSVETVSNASNVLCEENVQAVVHCADVPVTPIEEAPSLIQSSDVDILTTESPVQIESLEPLTSSNEFESESSLPVEPQLESKNNELEKDSDPPVVPPEGPIPPPPPLIGDTQNMQIPRPQFRLSDITKVKLKSFDEKKPETPPVDYSRQNSMAPSDHNLKFGSPQHKEFLEQLGQSLQQGSLFPPQIEFKKSPSFKTGTMRNGDVVKDSIDRDDVKKKLTLFLEKHNDFPLGIRNAEPKSVAEDDKNEDDFKEQHRRNMQNVFDSVTQKRDGDEEEKVDENKSNTVDENKTNTGAKIGFDRSQYKENMDSIFKSIRLRKVESFKKNESQ